MTYSIQPFHDEIARRLRDSYLEAKLDRARQPRPHYTNHPHSAGHPCDRYLVMLRVAWRLQTPLADPIKAALFDEGRHQERALRLDLDALPGFATGRQSLPIEIPEWQVTGEVDFFLRPLPPSTETLWYVTDAKSVSPGIFKALESWEDLVSHPRHFVRMWADQVLLYLVAARRDPQLRQHLYPDVALLLLKDKVTGDIRPIPVPWAEGWQQDIERRLLFINGVVKGIREWLLGGRDAPGLQPVWVDSQDPAALDELRRRLPPPLADPAVCPTCRFYGFCSQDITIPMGHAEVIEDPDLEAFLEIRERQREAHEEYREADNDAKGLLKQYQVTPGPRGKAYLLVGKFLVTVSQVAPRGKPAYPKYDIWRRPDPVTEKP